ncbi:MAG: hypothetical protein QW622_02560 [Candidatus Pacearchaeota archaeon]
MFIKKINKKAQFKIQQMTFMLAAVFLFFMLAGLFLVGIQVRNLRKQAQSMRENQAIMLAQFIAESPEFRCNTGLGSYCIDTDKIIFLINRPAYKEFWPVAYIKIVKLYPENKEICTTSNYPNCGVFNVFESKIKGTTSVGSYVALCRKEKAEITRDICELGRIIIGYKTGT